jgi:hypothetical protein
MNIPKTGSASATAGRLGDFIEPITYSLKVEVAMEPTATSSAQVPPAMLGPADVRTAITFALSPGNAHDTARPSDGLRFVFLTS